MEVHAESFFDAYGPVSGLVAQPVVDRKVGDVTVIDLVGPLVREQPVHVLVQRIEELLAAGEKKFAINLAKVDRADSYGIGGLAAVYNLTRQARGQVRFFAACERVLRTLHTLRLDTVFELFENEVSALSSFKQDWPVR